MGLGAAACSSYNEQMGATNSHSNHMHNETNHMSSENGHGDDADKELNPTIFQLKEIAEPKQLLMPANKSKKD